MKIVVATHNKGKIREFKAALAEIGIEAVGIGELVTVPEPVEDGDTFAANARIKAHYYMKACGLPCLADDSGLEVDALDGAPGVYSARYAGEPKSDARNNAALLVTRTLGLRNLDNLTRRPSDPDAPPWAGESFADQDGQQWTLLDVQALLADERFMDIGV